MEQAKKLLNDCVERSGFDMIQYFLQIIMEADKKIFFFGKINKIKSFSMVFNTKLYRLVELLLNFLWTRCFFLENCFYSETLKQFVISEFFIFLNFTIINLKFCIICFRSLIFFIFFYFRDCE